MRKRRKTLNLETAFKNLEDIEYPDEKRIRMLAFILKEIAIKVGCDLNPNVKTPNKCKNTETN